MVPGFGGGGDTWCQNSRLQNSESKCPLCKSLQVWSTCCGIWNGLDTLCTFTCSLSLFFFCLWWTATPRVCWWKVFNKSQSCIPPFDYMCVHAKSLQSYLTLCNPMACSPPSSSVHGVLQNTGVGCHPWCRIKSMLHKTQRKCFLYRIMGNF